ncbi:MAG TPA: hypothetical protein VMT69_00310 [Kineosporiaceae bacterium]|nr:hypothetical protein [Kineosporiaceae bacterium]
MITSAVAAPAAVIDLNGPGHYISWGFVQISWANAIVILLMIVVFALAILLPFPGRKR